MYAINDVLYSILECQHYCIQSSTTPLYCSTVLGKYVMLAVATSDRDIIETALWALNSVFLCVVFYSSAVILLVHFNWSWFISWFYRGW